MIIITILFAIWGFIFAVLLIVEVLADKNRCKKIVNSKEVYDVLKVVLTKKVSCDAKVIYSGDIIVKTTDSFFYPFLIEGLGYISIWSKSAKLIDSYCLSKKETKALELRKEIDKFWDKQKSKQ